MTFKYFLFSELAQAAQQRTNVQKYPVNLKRTGRGRVDTLKKTSSRNEEL